MPKILCITCDNVSCNDCMVEELEFMLEDYPGEAVRVRCFLHIVSIVAKTIIKQFDVPKKNGKDLVDILDQELYKLAEWIKEEEAQTLSERVDSEEDDNADADDLADNLDEEGHERLLAELCPIWLLLVKVRALPVMIMKYSHLLQLQKLAFNVIYSTTIILPVWHAILEQLNLPDQIMPCDVSTRWNSTFDMLNNTDWKISQQLRDTLKIFKDTTLFFSQGTPNLATVIPAMDLIDERLAMESINRALSVPIQAALGIAKTTMNKYYTKTDLSEVYRIAMGEHRLLSPAQANPPVWQSSTHIINSHTSKRPAGKLLGSRRQSLSSARYSNNRMRRLGPSPMLMKSSQLQRKLPRICSMSLRLSQHRKHPTCAARSIGISAPMLKTSVML